MGAKSATLADPPQKQAKHAATHLLRASAAQQFPSSRRECAAPGGTAVPKSFSGIPPLAPGEKHSIVSGGPGLRLPLQRKLAIGAINDPLEAEADAIAERVMRLADPALPPASLSGEPVLQRKCACQGTGTQCKECEEAERGKKLHRKAQTTGVSHEAPPKTLQRKAAGPAELSVAPPIVHDLLNSPGEPLDRATRDFMEPRFQRDFGHVRVHTGSRAAESARSVNALAFTVGDHISFGEGQYAPHSVKGKNLIAHELTHTLQQGRALHLMPVDLLMRPVQDEFEQEARRNGRSIAAGTLAKHTDIANSGLRLQRQGAGSAGKSCSVEICFASIRRFGLGTVGLKHAILNIDEGSGPKHIEVDPDFHQPVGMLHSHVVSAAGRKEGADCRTLPATCAETSAVVAAANEYESRDIVYDPSTKTGPNSNSFAEWTLAKAGLKTSSVSVPFGASGWDYFISNPIERTDPPHVIRTTPTPAGTSAKTGAGAACTKVFKPATTASDYVGLLREAESRMTAAGVSTNPEKIKILRGLYYGTPWSLDFAKEKSASRIVGFEMFTGTGVKYPRDPVSLFDCGLYQALQLSQDITAKSGKVDIGHLMIALDARNATVLGQPVPNLPFPGFGGSGVEIVTWLGDLGGGAASLALDRARSPKSPPPVSSKFTGTDYGAASNLEGDVSGFLVARGSAASSGGADVPSIPAGKGIADALDDYFGASGKAPSTAWDQRAKTFLTVYGGTFDATGNLTNAGTVIDTFADKIESFACEYLTQRKADSSAKISDTQFLDAADNIRPCSKEVAETFVNTLVDVSKSPGHALQATATSFAKTLPPSAGACPLATGALRLKLEAKKLLPGWLGGE